MLDLQYLADLFVAHSPAAKTSVREFSIQGQNFAFNSGPSIMGVVNLSADSWYRESVALTAEAAIRRGKVLAAQGARIVDLGAESSLAHAQRVRDGDQAAKLLPILKGLREAGVVVSVETYHASVARPCLEAGAGVINLTGAAQAGEIYRLAADFGAAVIICYVQGANVREVGEFDFGVDTIGKMEGHFATQIDLAAKAGLDKIIIDPGLGFYYRNLQDSTPRIRHQMRTFLGTFRLRTLGFPVCHALPHAFEYFGEEVRCAEPFFAVLAALGKTDIFRTHEVPRTKAVLDTLAAF
jgi:dihydropteroate synthase